MGNLWARWLTREDGDLLQRVQVPHADRMIVGAAEQVRGRPGERKDGPCVALKHLRGTGGDISPRAVVLQRQPDAPTQVPRPQRVRRAAVEAEARFEKRRAWVQRQLSVSQTRMVLSALTLKSLRPSTSTAHTISSCPWSEEPGFAASGARLPEKTEKAEVLLHHETKRAS